MGERPGGLVQEDLRSVVNVYGFRDRAAISHIQAQVDPGLADLELPGGYRIRQEGEIANMEESFSRLGEAILVTNKSGKEET